MEIRLFATLRDNREKIINMPWREGIDGAAILHELDISPDEAAIFLINGKHSALDTPLSTDDIVAIFPPVGGG